MERMEKKRPGMYERTPEFRKRASEEAHKRWQTTAYRQNNYHNPWRRFVINPSKAKAS